MQNELNEEDYLKQHLQQKENVNQSNVINSDIPVNKNVEINNDNNRTSELQYFSLDVKMLPCGDHYPSGSVLMIRAAQVKEIQAYAMVDDNNFIDIVDKMNDMLLHCVRIKYADGRMGTFLDIKDQDRLYLIFMIRELTFQEGSSLAVACKCPSCTKENSIEIKRDNFVFHDIDKRLNDFLDSKSKTFKFEIINNKSFELAPPTIGIQKAFTEYIVKQNNDKVDVNMAFLKIIPFMLPERSSITQEGIVKKLGDFETMDDISFQFLNSTVSKMTYGIKELKSTCECGQEIHTDMQFPNGASGIFVVHDAFEAYLKK